jgi:hypothetical protein
VPVCQNLEQQNMVVATAAPLGYVARFELQRNTAPVIETNNNFSYTFTVYW